MLSLYGAILGIVMLGVGFEIRGETAASSSSTPERDCSPAEILKPAPTPA